MGKIFKRGLLAIIPVAVTIGILSWLYGLFENLLKNPLRHWLGKYYFSGLGILVAFVLIFLIGVVVNNWLVQRLYHYFENLLQRIPLVKTLYKSICDLMSFFNRKEGQQGTVVLVDLGIVQMVGLLTRKDTSDLPLHLSSDEHVIVFVPLSYQIGGFTIRILRSQVVELNMTFEEAMRFVVTAGLLVKKEGDGNGHVVIPGK